MTLRTCVPLMLAGLALGGPATAQVVAPEPPELAGVDLEQRLDAPLPLDLAFLDENGRPVTLERYFGGARPVLLNFMYYRCPQLCGLVLAGLVDALADVDLAPGREFEIVTVSIDPRDTPTLARAKKQSAIEALGNGAAAGGWHFLTGKPDAVRALADAAGFGYRFLEDEGEFAHPAALILVTPDGRVARYLLGVRYDPRTLRLSLVEAGQGRIGTWADDFVLKCFRYDEQKGRYAPVARRIMRLSGAATVLVLGVVLVGLWRRESRRAK